MTRQHDRNDHFKDMAIARTFTLPSGDAVLQGTVVGSGPPVLLLHAGLERRQVWAPVVDEMLRSAELQCIAVDQRGHGESTGAVEGLADFVSDATALVEWVGRPAIIVGSSLGGYAALGALGSEAVREAVVGVVLVDVVPAPEPAGVRAFLTSSGLMPVAAELADDVLGRGNELRSLVMGFDGALMLVRGQPSAATDDDVERFMRDCPRARVESIEDAGHLIARDQPVRLGRLLSGVLPQWFAAPS